LNVLETMTMAGDLFGTWYGEVEDGGYEGLKDAQNPDGSVFQFSL
jgi:hypothetical protein